MRRRSTSQDIHDFKLPPEYPIRRRPSFHDTKPKEFVVHVAATKQAILQQEDTNRDYQVTIEDTGPKTIRLGTLSSGGFIKYSIHGTYMISSLLQELALASNSDEEKSTANYMVINEAILQENPVERLHRMIINQFWPSLIRRLDVKGLLLACADTKNRGNNQQPRIYIPHDDGLAKEYYQAIARDRPDIELDVVVLPEILEPKAIDMLRYNPGILSLALNMSINPDTTCSIVAAPFVVPGGRFNELYGWDSYFCATGLLADWGKAHSFLRLSKSMVENLIYEINHYGKILNANRSYYLTRSQPPFLTSMILKVYDKLAILRDSLEKNYHEAGQDIFNGQDVRLWLEKSVLAAIKEYKNVWMQEPRLIPRFGLSRYYDEGRGIPTETEATHYKTVLEEYSKKYNVTMEEFIDGYNSGKITEPTLDEYILHDRALRESGHDTTYRFEGRAANLLTVDLNSLLYKYEIDIAKILKEHFGGHLESDQGIEDSSIWFERAEMRKQTMYQLMWDPVKGLWFDYDFIKGEKSTYESATTFWTLWAGLTNPDDAKTMSLKSLGLFEMQGGLVAGTEKSRGPISLLRPNRQWDYPYGWAPHQMMAWEGFLQYGYSEIAHRLAYRWLFMITKCFADFNAMVPEKFDVVAMTHKITAEYGNVGTDFKFVPKEGFGWMNASYQVGLSILTRQEQRALGLLIPVEKIFKI